MELTIREETWPYIDEFFRNVPEAMRKIPTFQEALEKSEQSGVRQTLLLVLRHKFEEIPEAIEQRIAATENRKQLDQWLEEALDADSLEEIGFALDEEVDVDAN